MFNKQEYVNWLHGVSRHGKQNFPVENTETKPPTNSKEPIDLYEGGFWDGIDNMRNKIGYRVSKIRRRAERAEKSRAGTEYGAVAAGARKRSQGFYGHAGAADTGFGKPVGHDDEEVLARRDRQRTARAKILKRRKAAQAQQPAAQRVVSAGERDLADYIARRDAMSEATQNFMRMYNKVKRKKT